MENKHEADVAAPLLKICIKAVSKNMRVLEKQVWDIPSSLIEELLPHLNIFYLERIEDVAVRKGLSTASVWFGLWMEVVKIRPPGNKPIKDWRQKFLERLFHMVTFGHFSEEEHPRLRDPRFSLLSLAAKYVRVLILSRSLAQTSRLSSEEFRPVLKTLEATVMQLKLREIRLSLFHNDFSPVLFIIHRLLHHGSVQTLVMSKCSISSPSLWTWILRMSAGHQDIKKQEGSQSFSSRTQDLEDERRSDFGPNTSGAGTGLSQEAQGCNQEHKSAARKRRLVDDLCAKALKLPRLDISEPRGGAEPGGCSRFDGTPHLPLRQCVDSEILDPGCTLSSFPSLVSGKGGCPVRRITALVLDVCDEVISRVLSPLLSSWFCLCSLKTVGLLYVLKRALSRTDANVCGGEQALAIFLVISGEKKDLSALSACIPMLQFLTRFVLPAGSIEEPSLLEMVEALRLLYQNPACSLSVLSITSVCCRMSVAALLARLLSACPGLEALTLGFYGAEGNSSSSHQPAPIESSLKTLQVEFPVEPVHLQGFVTVLQGAQSLTSLHLKGLRCKTPQLSALLLALPGSNPHLLTLSLEELCLSGCQDEVLHLLNRSALQEVRFTDCRLFERNKEEFLGRFVDTVKAQTSLRSISVSKNRLGNQGLIAFADLFSENSPGRIQHLNVSSNYILPDGLLEFGRLLGRHPPSPHLKLDVRENPLDRDPQKTERAMRQLQALCHVTKDCWNSRTTFADHISVM
uniref:Leucine-rich repeat-containing protein 41 n=1 Tax=Lepisosteus oculatus TaxID=7918 RepID=W5M962_LEPOC